MCRADGSVQVTSSDPPASRWCDRCPAMTAAAPITPPPTAIAATDCIPAPSTTGIPPRNTAKESGRNQGCLCDTVAQAPGQMTSDTSLRPTMTPSHATNARSGAPRIQTTATQTTVADRPSKAFSRRSALTKTIGSTVSPREASPAASHRSGALDRPERSALPPRAPALAPALLLQLGACARYVPGQAPSRAHLCRLARSGPGNGPGQRLPRSRHTAQTAFASRGSWVRVPSSPPPAPGERGAGRPPATP